MVDKLRPHHPLEYQKLMEWAKGAKSILEVGSRYGYTLYDLGTTSGAKKVVGMDYPGDEKQWGFQDSASFLLGNAQRLKDQGIDAHVILENSHDPTAIAMARSLGPYDFIFIDANHTYEDVLQDWENYGPMGKRVVFHDIVRHYSGGKALSGVWKLWEMLREEPDTESFIAKDSPMGIGRIGSF